MVANWPTETEADVLILLCKYRVASGEYGEIQVISMFLYHARQSISQLPRAGEFRKIYAKPFVSLTSFDISRNSWKPGRNVFKLRERLVRNEIVWRAKCWQQYKICLGPNDKTTKRTPKSMLYIYFSNRENTNLNLNSNYRRMLEDVGIRWKTVQM